MIRSVGIDLGTSNTVIYHFRFNAGWPLFDPSPVKIQYPPERDGGFPVKNSLSFPSVLYLEETDDGVRPYVGAVAELMIANHPECPEARLFNTKRMMGGDVKFIHGYTAQMAAQEFYRCCGYSLTQDRDFRSAGQWGQVRHICITRPAAFEPYGTVDTVQAAVRAIQETVDAVARRDGTAVAPPKVEVLEEPQAALLTFLHGRLNDPAAREELFRRQEARGGLLRIAVVDIGGGTTDVSVQQLSVSGGQGEYSEEFGDYVAGSEYATDYVIRFINRETKDGSRSHFNPFRAFGGLDFDRMAAGHLMKRLGEACGAKGFNMDALSDNEKIYIRNMAMMEAKEFKDSLHTERTWVPKLDFIGFTDTVTVTYRQDEYDAWVSELVGSSQAPPRLDEYRKPCPTVYSIIADTLKSANLQPGDLDYMYVTGGMSLYPPVYQMLQEEFSGQTLLIRSKHDALNDIAMGAALYNSYFQIRQDAVILEENLMLDLPEGEPVVLADAGKPLPQEKNVEFKVTNPVEIAFDILMGREPLSPDLHKVKMLRARIPMTRIGTGVTLKFSISKELRIQITLCVHADTGEYEIPIDTSFNQNVAREE